MVHFTQRSNIICLNQMDDGVPVVDVQGFGDIVLLFTNDFFIKGVDNPFQALDLILVVVDEIVSMGEVDVQS